MSGNHEENEKGNAVDFDVIVGNPPYQEMIQNSRGSADANPIYHLFVQKAIELNPERVVMIVPSRWFNGGKSNLDSFRDQMINDRRLKRIVDYPDASDVFPGVQIRGGVNYFVWDRDHDGDCAFVSRTNGQADVTSVQDLRSGGGVVLRDARGISIINKVSSEGSDVLSEVVSKRYPFGHSIMSNYKFAEDTPFEGSIPLIYGDHVGYVRRDQIQKNHDWIGKHKVLIPMAGDPAPTKTVVLGQPIALAPGSACTQTYLVAGTFDTAEEAENYAYYLCTKFVRFLVLQRKSTQHVKPDKFLFVPKLDFTRRWTDEQLYDRFGLDANERAYVEATIKEREPILSLDSPIPASHLPGGVKYKPKKKES